MSFSSINTGIIQGLGSLEQRTSDADHWTVRNGELAIIPRFRAQGHKGLEKVFGQILNDLDTYVTGQGSVQSKIDTLSQVRANLDSKTKKYTRRWFRHMVFRGSIRKQHENVDERLKKAIENLQDQQTSSSGRGAKAPSTRASDRLSQQGDDGNKDMGAGGGGYTDIHSSSSTSISPRTSQRGDDDDDDGEKKDLHGGGGGNLEIHSSSSTSTSPRTSQRDGDGEKKDLHGGGGGIDLSIGDPSDTLKQVESSHHDDDADSEKKDLVVDTDAHSEIVDLSSSSSTLSNTGNDDDDDDLLGRTSSLQLDDLTQQIETTDDLKSLEQEFVDFMDRLDSNKLKKNLDEFRKVLFQALLFCKKLDDQPGRIGGADARRKTGELVSVFTYAPGVKRHGHLDRFKEAVKKEKGLTQYVKSKTTFRPLPL